MIKDRGIELVIVSNNSQERVDFFTENNDIIGYGQCGKPSIRKIMSYIDLSNKDSGVLFLGDQLFTDVICGKRMGVQTAIVRPIPGNETWKTLIKRNPEKWLFKVWKQAR